MPRSCHHDHQIPQAQFEARVPAHAQNNDLSVEVPAFEQIFDRDEPLHLFIFARHPRVCTRAHAPDRAAQSVPHPCFVSRPDSDRQTISQSLNRNTVRSSGSDTGSKQPDHETENTFRESKAGKNPQACGTGAVKDRSERKPEASRAMAVFDLLSGCPYIDLRCNRRSLTAKLRARELFQL